MTLPKPVMQCRGVTDKHKALQTLHTRTNTHTRTHNFHQPNFIKEKREVFNIAVIQKKSKVAWYKGNTGHEELLFGKGGKRKPLGLLSRLLMQSLSNKNFSVSQIAVIFIDYKTPSI